MAKYYDPDNTRLKCEENSYSACGHCGAEAGTIGGGDESLDFCHECDEVVEGHTIIRYYGVKDELGVD